MLKSFPLSAFRCPLQGRVRVAVGNHLSIFLFCYFSLEFAEGTDTVAEDGGTLTKLFSLFVVFFGFFDDCH